MSVYLHLLWKLRLNHSLFQEIRKNISRGYYSSYYFYSTSCTESSERKFDVLNIKSLQKKPRSVNYKICLHTIGSGAPGAPRSLYVFTHNKRFLFNFGEGSVRIAGEHNMKIGAVSEIFITSNSWYNVSGVPDFKQYVASSLNPYLVTTYGPSGLGPLMNTFNNLNPMESDSFKHIDIKDENFNFENSLNIKAVPIFPSDDLQENFRNKSEETYVVAFICQAPRTEGHVSMEKLLNADVPPGPLVNQLQSGLSVTLPNGTVVTPECVSSVYKRETFIVIEIPSVHYLDTLISCEAFRPYQGGVEGSDEDFPQVIVHFSPPEVMKNRRYLRWVNSFSPSVSHLVINRNNICLGLNTPLELQQKLNYILPSVFPLLNDSSIPFVLHKIENPNSDDLPNPLTTTGDYGFAGPTVQSNSILQYNIRPHKGFESSKCPVIYPVKILDWRGDEELFSSLFKEMNKKFEDLRASCTEKKRPYPNFLFLGTGSACSSVERNVSGILVNSDAENCLLMDCGEGIFSQMVRFMGIKTAHSTLRRLKLVYVSHAHTDHFLGLVSLLKQRQEAFRKTNEQLHALYILVPASVYRYLMRIHHCFEPILKAVVLVNNVNLMQGRHFDAKKHQGICHTLGLENIALTFVPHIFNSFAISVSHEKGWKFTYSGDTMPNTNLTRIGEDSDLLIHEASFEDGMEAEARKKRHSTVSQAIQAGRNMGARFTILTHFSQRYGMVPVMEGCSSDVGIAFDNMMVTLDDLPYLPHLYPILKELFYDRLERSLVRSFRRNMTKNPH